MSVGMIRFGSIMQIMTGICRATNTINLMYKIVIAFVAVLLLLLLNKLNSSSAAILHV